MASRFQRVAKRARIMMAWFPVHGGSGGGEDLLHCLMKASALRLATSLRRAQRERSPEACGQASSGVDAVEGKFSSALSPETDSGNELCFRNFLRGSVL